MDGTDEATRLLREIRDLQREQLAMLRAQQERGEREASLAHRALGGLKTLLWIAIPLLALALLLTAWPYARYMLG